MTTDLAHVPQPQRDRLLKALDGKFGVSDGFMPDGVAWHPEHVRDGVYYLMLRHPDGRRRRFIANREEMGCKIATWGRNTGPDDKRSDAEFAQAIQQHLAGIDLPVRVEAKDWAGVITVTLHGPRQPTQVWEQVGEACGTFQTDHHSGPLGQRFPTIRYDWNDLTPEEIARQREIDREMWRAQREVDEGDDSDAFNEELRMFAAEQPRDW